MYLLQVENRHLPDLALAASRSPIRVTTQMTAMRKMMSQAGIISANIVAPIK